METGMPGLRSFQGDWYVVVPLMLYFGRDDSIPLWIACVILSAIMLLGVYVTLPRAKGAVYRLDLDDRRNRRGYDTKSPRSK